MYEFVFIDDIRTDLLRISVKSPTARGRILAALEAAEHDPQLHRELSSQYFRTHGEQDTDIKRWVLAKQLGFDISRFRFHHIEENGYCYRVVFAIDRINEYCYVLAILRRDEIDYDDPNNHFNQRIFASYRALDL